MNKRELFIHILDKYIGTPYRWGGDDPSGFDCSGVYNEAAQSAGLLGRKEDRNAEGWYVNSKPIHPNKAQPGDPAFWKDKNGKVIHMEAIYEIIEGMIFTIGASGGTSKTLTVADAFRDNAFVKVRPIRDGYEIRSIF